MDKVPGTNNMSIRVLVIAEAANPEWTSVPLIGWSHYKAISEKVDAHLVTQIRNSEAIKHRGWEEGRDFTAIDTEVLDKPAFLLAKWLRGGDKLGWTIATAMSNLTYSYFEYKVWQKFKDRLIAGEFDVVHRITPLTPTAPSYLAGPLRKLGIPLVIGPLNGGLDWPKGFHRYKRKEREWLHSLRFLYKLIPWVRSGRRNASAILCGSHTTYRELSKNHPGKVLYLPENGIDSGRFNQARRWSQQDNEPLKVVFVGRLVPLKGCDMLLRAAMPLLESDKMTLEFVGDGPELVNLRSMAESSGIGSSNVKFHGWVEHENVQEILARADILALPSIREFGGGVVLEAMALGVVPVVANYGGPAELVSEEFGFKLDMSSPKALEEDIGNTLTLLVSNRQIIEQKGARAKEEVDKSHLWERRAEMVIATYDWVLGRAEKPQLHIPGLCDS